MGYICALEYYSAVKRDERKPLVVTSMNLQIVIWVKLVRQRRRNSI